MRAPVIAIAVTLLAGTSTAGPEQALLDRQLAALTMAGTDALRATLDPKAPIVLPARHATPGDFEKSLEGEGGSLLEAKATKGKVVIGTRGDLTWIAAEAVQPYEVVVDCQVGSARCKKKRTIRVTELVRNGKGIALHIDDPVHDDPPGEATPIAPTTKAPKLAGLLAKPAELAKVLLDDPQTIVLGTELKERAVGVRAAKQLLASWSKLALAVTDAREDLAAGYVVANVSWTKRPGEIISMRATMFVVTVDGEHRVAAVHYSTTYDRPLYR